jgi:long-subunit fatty acid transport protein
MRGAHLPFVMILVASLSGAAAAQDVSSPPVEIPFTTTMGFGARALGMGGAHIAVVEDLSAIYYNPAGLAQIRRIEAAGTLTFDRRDQNVTLSGTSSDVALRNTHLNSIGFAYPFPTYRGSLVIAGAFNRRTNLNSDYLRQGSLPPYDSQETESIIEEGSLDTWSAAMAVDVSPNISIGGVLSYISGSTDRQRDFVYTDPNYDDVSSAQTNSDISGWTGSFGSLVRLGPLARLGFQVQFPQTIDIDGSEIFQESYTDRDSTENSYDAFDEFSFKDEVELPFSFGVGVAVTPPNFLMAADIRYTDWTQLRYAGPVRYEYTEPLSSTASRVVRTDAYGGAAEIHLGAEYVLPFYPVRFRAGFYTEPLAYRLVLTDVFGGANREATFDPDRRFFTLGVGALFEDVLTVDVAYVHGSYERSAVQMVPDAPIGSTEIRVSESQDIDRVYVTTALRF